MAEIELRKAMRGTEKTKQRRACKILAKRRAEQKRGYQDAGSIGHYLTVMGYNVHTSMISGRKGDGPHSSDKMDVVEEETGNDISTLKMIRKLSLKKWKQASIRVMDMTCNWFI